jgi:mannose-6-phosphate isomerase
VSPLHAGESLRSLVEKHPGEILGKGARSGRFPLLIKLLDAKDDLSVQVHPSDADLRSAGRRGSGKTEAWIILAAERGARIVHGLGDGVDRDAFFRRMVSLGGKALPRAEVETHFGWRAVRPGQVIFVPAGTIHAVGRGITLLEVQQTSDVTYRIYDWGRSESSGARRELHLAEARAVASPGPVPCPFATLHVPASPGATELIGCEHFRMELVALGPGLPHLDATTGGATFHVLAGLEGSAVCSSAGHDPVTLRPGAFALLPAALGDYTLRADESSKVLRVLPGREA